ncbi:hypothetical protein N7492_002080 [Penicillium capsulatum]|uniref:Uncharacterized protein n=1 Tax=Penicillium capsulatum TaxID=69766 RepID=A0A9W9LVC6_9EURO|nr:hypothetical protein N7492_002080 [Penicillium capsulatum]KAJ6123306.1 hypothetical protein N7512_005771 [Penicillium capsulatum]
MTRPIKSTRHVPSQARRRTSCQSSIISIPQSTAAGGVRAISDDDDRSTLCRPDNRNRQKRPVKRNLHPEILGQSRPNLLDDAVAELPDRRGCDLSSSVPGGITGKSVGGVEDELVRPVPALSINFRPSRTRSKRRTEMEDGGRSTRSDLGPVLSMNTVKECIPVYGVLSRPAVWMLGTGSMPEIEDSPVGSLFVSARAGQGDRWAWMNEDPRIFAGEFTRLTLTSTSASYSPNKRPHRAPRGPEETIGDGVVLWSSVERDHQTLLDDTNGHTQNDHNAESPLKQTITGYSPGRDDLRARFGRALGCLRAGIDFAHLSTAARCWRSSGLGDCRDFPSQTDQVDVFCLARSVSGRTGCEQTSGSCKFDARHGITQGVQFHRCPLSNVISTPYDVSFSSQEKFESDRALYDVYTSHFTVEPADFRPCEVCFERSKSRLLPTIITEYRVRSTCHHFSHSHQVHSVIIDSVLIPAVNMARTTVRPSFQLDRAADPFGTRESRRRIAEIAAALITRGSGIYGFGAFRGYCSPGLHPRPSEFLDGVHMSRIVYRQYLVLQQMTDISAFHPGFVNDIPVTTETITVTCPARREDLRPALPLDLATAPVTLYTTTLYSAENFVGITPPQLITGTTAPEFRGVAWSSLAYGHWSTSKLYILDRHCTMHGVQLSSAQWCASISRGGIRAVGCRHEGFHHTVDSGIPIRTRSLGALETRPHGSEGNWGFSTEYGALRTEYRHLPKGLEAQRGTEEVLRTLWWTGLGGRQDAPDRPGRKDGGNGGSSEEEIENHVHRAASAVP